MSLFTNLFPISLTKFKSERLWLQYTHDIHRTVIFLPLRAIKAVGYSDHQRRAIGPAVTNSALTKKLTDEFCLFFTDMTYVPGQFIPSIFFGTKP